MVINTIIQDNAFGGNEERNEHVEGIQYGR